MSVDSFQAPPHNIDALLRQAISTIDSLDLRVFAPDEAVSSEPAVIVPDESSDPPTTDELRRLTIMFSDLVGSTALSGELDPESYRRILSTYQSACKRAIDEVGGHVVHTRGDGILAVFGYPVPHDDDAERAVRAGLRIHEELEAMTDASLFIEARLQARVGIHRGLVYLEQETGDVYGLAVNVASRVQELATAGTVAISDEVLALLADDVRTRPLSARPMKGVVDVPELHQVIEVAAEGPRARRRWSSPIIGRRPVLDRLVDRVEEAATAEHPLAIAVVGEAGVGKSRLVDAALDEVGERTRVVRMDGSPRRTQGLAPVRVLLRSWAGIGPEHAPREALARLRSLLVERGHEDLLPLVAPVAGIGPEAGYEPVSSDQRKLQTQILDAVHTLLSGRLAVAPAVLVVEDVHWVDGQTAALLDRLIVDGPPGLAVILCSREPVVLGTVHPVDEPLGPLSDDEVVDLIGHLRPDPPPALVADVLARADGVPFFVEELVRSHDMPEASLAAASETGIPPALYDSLYARLGALGEERLLVSAAATLGRVVDLDVLAQVVERPTEWLDRAVATLVRQDVFDPDHGDGRTVRFRHELVRLVAYEIEPPSGRRGLHERAAVALAGQGPGADWMRIAHHWHEGGDGWGAVEALDHAAADARRRGSLDEARSVFDRSLEVLHELPRDARRDRREVELRLHRGFLAVSSEGFSSEHGAEDYSRCLELALGHPASDEMYRTLIALWGFCLNRSDLDGTWSVSTALRGLSKGQRAALLPANEAGFGMIEWYRGSFDEAARRLGDAVTQLDVIGPDVAAIPSDWTMPLDAVGSMHIHRALAQFWVGDVDGADESFRLARSRCASLPFPLGPFTDVYALLLGSWMDAERDDPGAGLKRAIEAGEISERHGFEAWSMWAATAQMALGALADPSDDQLHAHSSEIEAHLELWHALGIRVLSGSIHSVLARALLNAGLSEKARAITDIGTAWAEQSGSVPFQADVLRVRALAGPEETRADGLVDALCLAERQGAVVASIRIATDLVRCGGPAHRGRLESALARMPAGTTIPVVVAARAALAEG